MLKFLGISLLCTAFYFWQLKPVYKAQFGGALGSKIYVGRLAAILAFISGVVLIFIG